MEGKHGKEIKISDYKRMGLGDYVRKDFGKHKEAGEKKKEMAKKMQVKHEGRDMYFQKTTKRGETRLHAK